MQTKVDGALQLFEEFLQRAGVQTSPSAIVTPLEEAVNHLQEAGAEAKAIMEASGNDVLVLNVPEMKSVVTAIGAGKRAVALCTSMMAAVAKSMSNR